jgi:hypothetical protein
LVLRVDSAGPYSLQGRPEGGEAEEAQRRDLLAVGVVHADGIVAVRPTEEGPTTPPSTTS